MSFTFACGEGEPLGGGPSDGSDGSGGSTVDEILETLSEEEKAVVEDIKNTGDGVWEYLPVPGSRCRDGSEAGFAVNPASTTKNLVIFLDEGGACFNGLTCEANAASNDAYVDAETNDTLGDLVGIGLLSRDEEENPEFSDWGMAFVPYCTGDVHAGNATGTPQTAGITGVPVVGSLAFDAGPQEYRGYANVRQFLNILRVAYPEVERVLFAGSSAGALGVIANKPQVEEVFSGSEITVVSDSAPPMDSSVMSVCLQQEWRELWGLDDTILAGQTDLGNDASFVQDTAVATIENSPDVPTLFVSSKEDEVMRVFYAFGKDDDCGRLATLTFDEVCAVADSGFLSALPQFIVTACQGAGEVPDPRIAESTYLAGLEALQERLDGLNATTSTFYVDGDHHVFLENSDAATGLAIELADERLDSWIASFASTTPAEE